jgi:tRNA(fMet)-specific endonuclease VapC
MMYVLDTDIFTLAYYNTHGIRERIAGIRLPDMLSITVMTRIQGLQGRFEAVRKAASAADLLRMQSQLDLSEAFLSEFRLVLPFSPDAGSFFDQFRKDKQFSRMDRGDMLIACIALRYKATLVTRNVRDYAHVPNLKVENWAD